MPVEDTVAVEVFVCVGMTAFAAERALIMQTLKTYGGNKTAAAQVLGISRRSIYNKLAVYAAGRRR